MKDSPALFCCRPIMVCLLAWASCATLQAAENPAQSFHQALQNALENNPNMASAAASLRSAEEKYSQAMASLLPSIDLEAGKSKTSVDYQKFPSQNTNIGRLGVSMNQVLFNWQAIEAYRQADPFVKAYVQDFEAMRQTIAISVVQGAIEWLQARDVVDLADNNLRLTEHQLEATQARFTVGELTMTDVSQALARVSLARANKISADNSLAAADARYVELVGFPPVDNLVLPTLNPASLTISAKEAQNQMMQRPDLEAARLRLAVAESNIELEKAGHLPTVNLSSTYFKKTDVEVSGFKTDLNEFTMGVTMNLPLFKGGLTTSRTQQARADRDNQMATYDRLLQQIQRETTQAILDIKSADASVKALEDGVKASKAAMEGVEQEFQVGTRTSLDLLDAQNEYFTAQTNLAKSRYSWELARFRLLKAVGRLTLNELGMVGE
ncbi:MAG: TolC family outer membrane protein [Magnetococcales bacterium]|nr:TolC family outer membrane protein [Magnetococcales bacterium]NGZ25604.1 TolC family outer membrane protein [Magnetococcales bacterium]